ncbi:MAG: hypothetical protein IPJ32_09190 [Sphingobacteriaceae bacterium]|nr:hypothetical protein [Sphingobacteriaceae bacterium]
MNTIKLILVTILFTITQFSFSENPGIIFMNAKGEVTTVFLAGEEIRGRINLPKPVKDYLKGETATQIRIDVRSTSDEISGIAVTKMLRASELNNSYIDFDVYPTAQKAKDIYESGLGFFFSFYPTNASPKGVIKFEVAVGDEYNENYNGLSKMEVSGEISIDYTKITANEYSKLWSKGKDAHDAAEANASKIASIENAESVKSMPLPIVFTKPSKAGYTGYSNAVIINMIKARYKINAVYMLTFDEPDGLGDFNSLKDLNNYPSEKLGNHVFYFAFKDELDGQYKFAGGRLRMLYEGNGKYSEAFIFPYSPLMNNDPKFPFDYARKDLGFESVFFMDGAKIKK